MAQAIGSLEQPRSRRNFVKSTGLMAAAFTAFASPRTFASPGDERLKALHAEWHKANALMEEAFLETDRRLAVAFQKRPKPHPSIVVTHHNATTRVLTDHDIDLLEQQVWFPAMPKMRREAIELKRAMLQQYHMAIVSLNAEYRVPEAEAATEAAIKVVDNIEDAILATPAETMEGVSIKLTICQFYMFEDNNTEIALGDHWSVYFKSALADVKRLTNPTLQIAA